MPQLNWFSYSLIALVLFAIMVVLITFLSKKGLSVQIILFCLFGTATVLYGIQTAMTVGFSFPKSIPIILCLILVGFLSFAGNFAQFKASTTAPNAGLAIAVVNLYAGLTAVLSFLVFRQVVTPMQAMGMIVSLIGISLISFGAAK